MAVDVDLKRLTIIFVTNRTSFRHADMIRPINMICWHVMPECRLG